MIAAHVVEWIRARVAESGGWEGKSIEDVVSLCNAQTAANPVASPPLVPRTMYESELLALLSTGSLAALALWPSLGLVKADIVAQNRPAIPVWASLLRTVGIIKADEERDALIAYATTPVEDPGWTALIGEARAALGRDVTTQDVIASRED